MLSSCRPLAGAQPLALGANGRLPTRPRLNGLRSGLPAASRRHQRPGRAGGLRVAAIAEAERTLVSNPHDPPSRTAAARLRAASQAAAASKGGPAGGQRPLES